MRLRKQLMTGYSGPRRRQKYATRTWIPNVESIWMTWRPMRRRRPVKRRRPGKRRQLPSCGGKNWTSFGCKFLKTWPNWQERIRQMILQERHQQQQQQEQAYSRSRSLKVTWKSEPDDGDYTQDRLYRILYKYGDITALIISPKGKGSALDMLVLRELVQAHNYAANRWFVSWH